MIEDMCQATAHYMELPIPVIVHCMAEMVKEVHIVNIYYDSLTVGPINFFSMTHMTSAVDKLL